jgi:hypothetical protein
MRRFLATLLAVLFSFLLIMPAWAASIKPDLPACCRKEGKHRCAMQAAGHASESAVVAVSDKCPFFPQTSLAPHHEINAITQAAAIFAGWMSHPGGSPQIEAVYRISLQRSHQKRGPPFLSSISSI